VGQFRIKSHNPARSILQQCAEFLPLRNRDLCPLTVTVLPISLTAPLFSRWRPARPSWQQEQHLEVTVQFLTSRFVQYDVD
jgi:hypothetical protein